MRLIDADAAAEKIEEKIKLHGEDLATNMILDAFVKFLRDEDETPTYENKIKTNGDKLRAMTDEELADWLTDGHDICDMCQFGTCRPEFECEKGVFEWIRQEVLPHE